MRRVKGDVVYIDRNVGWKSVSCRDDRERTALCAEQETRVYTAAVKQELTSEEPTMVEEVPIPVIHDDIWVNEEGAGAGNGDDAGCVGMEGVPI